MFTFVLNRTTYGLKIRAVGENPSAADTVGISVARIRWSTVIIGCTMAGLAGAALLLLDSIFQENLTQSEGFIAVALVYFGAWRPIGVMGGSVLYGLTIAVVLEWKSLNIIPLSRLRPRRNGAGGHHDPRPAAHRSPLPAAGRSRQALRERRLTTVERALSKRGWQSLTRPAARNRSTSRRTQ